MKKSYKFLRVVGIAFCLLSLASCISTGSVDKDGKRLVSSKPSVVETTQKSKYETYISAGDQLPITSVTTIDGKRITLDNDESKKLIILFATWCSDSQRAMKALRSSSILQETDLQIIAIARENTIEEVNQFRSEYNLDIEMVADTSRSIYKKFASAGIPRFILADKNNRVIKSFLAEGQNQLEQIEWRQAR